MGFLVRRSVPSLVVLLGLLIGGGAVLVWLGAPVWVPVVLAVGLVALQWAVNPYLIQWLIPADRVPLTADGSGYDTEHPVGRFVAERCREAGLPLARLGIVDDGTPNAFAFGHHRGDARIWVTRGLLERLDEPELDAVVSHEVGHVRNNDFVVMTVASLVPVLLYYVFLATRSNPRRETVPIMVGAYVGYLVAQLFLLALSRSRELAADHHACAVTGDGDALCSALVKISYGMGEVQGQREAEVHRLQAELKGAGWKAKRETNKAIAAARRQGRRVQSMKVMGIADPDTSAAVAVAADHGLRPDELLGALRWDTCTPWASFQEKLSSHPIVVHRMAALERSGLPGAPKVWAATRVEASCEGEELARVRRRFAGELAARFAPWASVAVLLAGWWLSRPALVVAGVLAAGVTFFARSLLMRPPVDATPVDRITSLLDRLDASPVNGLAVSLRGRVIGRGMPGYVLSPELVVQDGSGFVPLLYRQPIPFARSVFALLRAGEYRDQEVLVHGWYRRGPGPYVELREVVAADGTRSRTWWWAAALALPALAALAGAVGVLVVAL